MEVEVWVKRDDPAVLVEAVRLNEENVDSIAIWTGAEAVQEIDPEHPQEKQTGLNIQTFGGVQRASLGMYVVRYANNFLVYHTRPFEEKYKPRDRQAPPPESAGDTRKRLGFADPFDQGRLF